MISFFCSYILFFIGRGKEVAIDNFKISVSMVFSDRKDKATNDDNSRRLFVGALFLAFVSLLLTILNIAKHWWFMANSTTCLILGFILAAFLAKKKHCTISAVIMAILVGVIFSYYAISGKNEGFACLWILIVPILGMNLVGLKIGTALCLYYQIFLIVLFYTPLKVYVQDYYTETFLIRFPLLYFASFGGVTLLAIQKQFYLEKTVDQALHDGLTNLNNRAYYTEMLTSYDQYEDVAIVVFDLNRLKYINDTYGHAAGDEVICNAADAFRKIFTDSGFIARTGGDEFAVITRSSQNVINDRLNLLKETISSYDVHGYGLSISCGVASRIEFPSLSMEGLAMEADKRMYQDKISYYEASGYAYR